MFLQGPIMRSLVGYDLIFSRTRADFVIWCIQCVCLTFRARFVYHWGKWLGVTSSAFAIGESRARARTPRSLARRNLSSGGGGRFASRWKTKKFTHTHAHSAPQNASERRTRAMNARQEDNERTTLEKFTWLKSISKKFTIAQIFALNLCKV